MRNRPQRSFTLALWLLAITTTLVVVMALSGCGSGVSAESSVTPQPSPSSISASPSLVDDRPIVAPEGGSYEVIGLTVTVPSGAVSEGVALDGSPPVRLNNEQLSPLQNADGIVTQFSVSLNSGVQPSKPVQLSIPMYGSFTPAEVEGQTPLFYIASANGASYQAVPLTSKSGRWHVTVDHLGPMWLVWVTPTASASPSTSAPAPVVSPAVAGGHPRPTNEQFIEAVKRWGSRDAADGRTLESFSIARRAQDGDWLAVVGAETWSGSQLPESGKWYVFKWTGEYWRAYQAHHQDPQTADDPPVCEAAPRSIRSLAWC